jgi:2-polyprenyl-3-methyl-5-hydroxy-6-metoxy-1,4-benzoquinol methylase
VRDLLLRVLGWRSLLLHGDPCVLDRWLWLRTQLRPGAVRTFDAGCGNGVFSVYAARAGNDVVAASFSSAELERARERAELLGVHGIRFRTLDLREIDAHSSELGRFDQVICLETIEHVDDDAALVRALAALLEPGGTLLLSAPFADHRPLYSEERDPSAAEDGSHVRYGYSRERLRELLEQAGLQLDSEELVSGVVSQKVTNLMRRLTLRVGRPLAWLLVLPLRALAVLDRPLTKLLDVPGLSIAVRAVKPA